MPLRVGWQEEYLWQENLWRLAWTSLSFGLLPPQHHLTIVEQQGHMYVAIRNINVFCTFAVSKSEWIGVKNVSEAFFIYNKQYLEEHQILCQTKSHNCCAVTEINGWKWDIELSFTKASWFIMHLQAGLWTNNSDLFISYFLPFPPILKRYCCTGINVVMHLMSWMNLVLSPFKWFGSGAK